MGWPGGACTGLRGPGTPSIPYSAVRRAFRGVLVRRSQTSSRHLNSSWSQPRESALMWARRWPGRKPRHSARPVKAVRLDSEPRVLVTASVRHRETPARQRHTEPTPRDNASSQFADDSSLMRRRNTTLDQPVLERRSTWKDSNEAGATTQYRARGQGTSTKTPDHFSSSRSWK